ncbi:MAG: ABC transporter permease [Mucilaginibacter sp.]|uniref:ABC transporter permease n=1 Tax=Mucilaginibacter sp. TaxID=1882438 RepID=UPI0034E5EB8D
MIWNYLKSAARSFKTNKGFSLLNIFGLAIGITCAALIFLWVEDEVNWDKFNLKKDNLFFVRVNEKYDSYTATTGSTPALLAPQMLADIPGVANTCRIYDMDATLFAIGNKTIYAGGIYADPALFSMFALPFVQGNAHTAFSQPFSLVITEKTAKKFFGNARNVVGKTIRVDNKQDYIVSGVLKDIPTNSTLQFEYVAPFKIVFDEDLNSKRWGSNWLSTYVELKPKANLSAVNKQLLGFIRQHAPQSVSRPFLWNMSQWHLYDEFENGKATGGGQIQYVHLFSIIAWIILLIACINFMNLSTARSEKRAREVGVRKVLGAGKQSLVFQFIGEALLMALLAAVVAVVLLAITLPAFNNLVQKQLSLGFTQPSHLAVLLLIATICGLVAGSYPSFYLSSFSPVSVLKGAKLKDGNASFIRKSLVVLQFTVSIVLIISTIIIYQQIQHVKNRVLGFDKNNLIETDAQGDASKYYNPLKQDLLQSGVVSNVALSNHPTLYGGTNTGNLTWQGKSAGSKVLVSFRKISPEYISTSGIKLLEGRDFVPTDSLKSKNVNVIITRTMEKLMGNESAVGKAIWSSGDTSGTKMTVIGVTNDYVYGNMYGTPDPVLFLATPLNRLNKMYLRIKHNTNMEQALAKVETIIRKNNPAYPFNYKFVDDQFNQLFISETLISKLSRVFASLAIIISCLGLFGLAAYTAERRTKEIGVRKVLGASVGSIAGLLSFDFLKLVGLSCLLSFPIAWWAMHQWLQAYQYRIEISFWIFLIAGTAACLIAIATISFQAVKAALANPVESLRSE